MAAGEMDSAAAGRSLACESCGHALTIAQLGADATCPFCGHRQQSAQVLAQLVAYQRTARATLTATAEEAGFAAQWAEWAKPDRNSRRHMAITYAVILGAIIGVTLISVLLSDVHIPNWLDAVTGLGLYAIMMLSAGLVFRQRHGSHVERPQLDQLVVACPNCGARGRLAVGQGLATCAYCGAALVPSRAAIAHTLDAAREAERHARIASYRVGRQLVAREMGGSARGVWLVLVGMWPALLVFGVGYEIATSGKPFSPENLAFWGSVVAVVAALALVVQYRRSRRAAWRAAMGALARQFSGRVLPKLDDRVAWWNRYWPGNIGAEKIYQAYSGTAAALDAAGFPAMLIIDPVDPMARSRRVEIFLAASVPGVSDAPNAPASPIAPAGGPGDTLRARGFSLKVDSAGYVAEQEDPDNVRALNAAPARSRELAVVINALAQIAAAARAVPAAPIP